MKHAYIIVGDNNYWYTTTEPVTPEELEQEIKQIIEGIWNNEYHSMESIDNPTELFAYPLSNSTTERTDFSVGKP
jgi:hypothetical protein